MWVGEYNTFEKAIGSRRPVLTHLFYGDTYAEVMAIVRAHMQSDKFFDGCTNKGRFGTIECWTEYRVYERSRAASGLNKPDPRQAKGPR